MSARAGRSPEEAACGPGVPRFAPAPAVQHRCMRHLRPFTRRSFVHTLPALATVLAAPPGQAAPAPAPTGRVVLSIGGKVRRTNAEGRLDLDMAALEALPQKSFTTATPWYKEPVSFTGPLLREVLALAEADGAKLTAVALNDYKVELPVDDLRRWDVVLARLLDGKPMATRDKGPLFIVYPFHQSAELRSERYYSRCAWQLRQLIVA